MSYFALIVNFGFVGYGTLCISAYRNDRRKYSGYFWSIVVVRGCLLVLSLFAYLVLLFIIIRPQKELGVYLLLSLTIFANFFDITYLFQGLENFKIISITSFLIRILGFCGLFIFVKERTDFLVYVFIQTLQIFLVATIPWIFAPKAVFKPDRSYFAILDTFKDSFFFFLPTLAVTLCSLVDKTMLGSMKGTTEVAYYEQADKIILMVVNVLHAFAPVFLSRISYYVKQKMEDEIHSKIVKMFELYFIIGIPSIFGLYAVKDMFVPAFFGHEFLPSIEVIAFLIPLILILASSNAIGNVYYGPRNLIWMTSIFYGVGTVINICVNSLLIPMYGAKGAAAASLLSETIIALLFIVFSKKSVNYIKIAKMGLKPLIASLVMFFAIVSVNRFVLVKHGYVFTMVIDVAIGIFLYTIFIILFKEELVIKEIRILKQKITKHNIN